MQKKKLLFTVITFIMLYILQFFLFPKIASRYFPLSNEVMVFLYGSLAIVIVLVELWMKINIKHWFIGDLVYLLLIFIYHGRGLYGIGLWGFFTQTQYYFSIAVASIIVIAIYIVIIEIMAKLLFAFFRRKK